MTAAFAEDIALPAQDAVPAKPLKVLLIKEMSSRGKEWELTLHAEHLALADSAQGRPFVILRDQMMKTAVLAEPVRALVLTQPLKLTFKLTAETAVALAEWIGKPALARHYLKQRYGLVLPAAILCMVGSLPLPGNPAAGVQPIPFNPLSLTLGILLAVSWALAKWRPRPLLFLMDSIWFFAMGAQLVASIMNGRSKGLLVLLPFLLWMVVRGVKHFRRFCGTTIPRSA
jgi:hypothetical protein